MKMSSANEVKRESEGKLSEASANEKFLHSRVTELEKKNQKLEKKVKKTEEEKERAERGGCQIARSSSGPIWY